MIATTVTSGVLNEIAVDTFGSPSGPTIIFVHGGGIAGWSWRPQAQAFLDYHCLVPDLPGHGKSLAAGVCTVERGAGVIAELIRTRANDGKAHVVGLSLGGQITIQLLATAPEVVDSAVVSGTNVHPLSWARVFMPLVRVSVPLLRIRWFARLQAKAFSVPDDCMEDYLRDSFATDAGLLQGMVESSLSYRMPRGLPADKRVLVLAGSREVKAMFRSARDLTQAMPLAVARVAPKARHTWNFEFPDLFNRSVRSWIRGSALPAELQPLP